MNKLAIIWRLFYIFFKIGCSTFGGGYAMMPLIQQEAVDKHHWVEEEEMVEYFAISQSIPGVVAINSSIFVGNKVMGIGGAIAAVLGVSLPAVFAILLIIWFLSGIENNIYVEKVFKGIRAATAALVLMVAVRMGKTVLKTKTAWFIAVVAFSIIVMLNVSAVWAVIFGAVFGYGMYLFNRRV